jgi:HEAT repeat protein
VTRPILIAHAPGDEPFAERLAAPVTAAGYTAVHGGTVLVGESVIEEVSRALAAGAPVVLCGTIRAMGTGWAWRVVQAARALNAQVRIYGIAVEKDVFLQPLTLDGEIAEYWRDPAGALGAVVTALRKHYPLDAAPAPAGRGAAAERRFRELLLQSCDIIDLANLPVDRRLATQELMLRNLFLPLTVRVGIEAGQDVSATALAVLEKRRLPTTGPDAPSRVVDATDSPGARLRSSRRLVVLGDPGSGKTTLLRWMTTAYLLRLRADPAWAELPGVGTLPDEDWLPILIRCRDLGAHQVDGTFEDILMRVLRRAELGRFEVEELQGDIAGRLAAGTALLLVDGLDEIGDPRARGRFCRLLERVHLSHPLVPIVVTSRIVGYRELGQRIGRGFEHVTIAELTGPAKDDFARRWCAVTEPPERRGTMAGELIADIHSTDRIERLTGNPMLLTTLALVKRNVGKLPDHRADLYREAVQVLLSWRAEVDEPISTREAEPQLQYLAYAMSDQGVQQLTEDELIDLLERMRVEYPQLRAIGRHEPAEFIRLLERRTGILIEAGHRHRAGRPVPVFEFRHLTFQEYLTALALVQGHFPGREPADDLAARVGRLAVRAGGSHDAADTWREAIRLCVTLCHGDDVDRVLRALVEQDFRLAARCLEDDPDASPAVVHEILEPLVRAIPTDTLGSRTWIRELSTLSHGPWNAEVNAHLLRGLRARGPAAVQVMGGLCGRAALLRRAESQHDPLSPDDLALSPDDLAVAGALAHGAAAADADEPAAAPIEQLLTTLERTDPVCVAAAAWALAEWQEQPGVGWWPSDRHIDRVVAVARRPDLGPATLLSLIAAIGPRRWPGAAETLTNAVADADPVIRALAAELLGSLGQENTPAVLLDALADEIPAVRAAAARGSGRSRGSAAREALHALLLADDARSREAAVSALGKIGETESVDRLIAALGDPAPEVRWEAVTALGEIGDGRAFEPLVALLSSSDDPSMWRVVQALGEIGDDRAVPALLALLDGGSATETTWIFYVFAVLEDLRAVHAVRSFMDRSGISREWAYFALGGFAEWEPANRPVIESALTDENPDVRRAAMDSLSQRSDDWTLAQAVGLAGDPSTAVRRRLAEVLSRFDGPLAESAARTLAKDADAGVRRAAMKAAGAQGDDGFPALADGTRDADARVRWAAVTALGGFQQERAWELVAAAAGDPLAPIRESSARGLSYVDGPRAPALLWRLADDRDPDVRAHAMSALATSGTRRVLPRLFRQLRAADATEREQAARSLGNLHDDRAIEPLTEALADPRATVREGAAAGLGMLDSARVAEILIAHAGDPAPAVRREIAASLGEGGLARAQPALRALLDDPHPQVRAWAASAMGDLDLPARIPVLSAKLADPHPDVRMQVVYALDDISALDEIRSCLDDPNLRVRKAAIWTLGLIGDLPAAPPLRALAGRVAGTAREFVVEALSLIEGPSARPLLTESLDDSHPRVRRIAVRRLRRGDEDLVRQRLRAALGDPNRYVRREAVTAVSALGDHDATEPLLAILRGDPDPWLRERAALALGRLGPEPALAALRGAAADHDVDVRQAAAFASGLLGDLSAMTATRERMGELTAVRRRRLVGSLATLGDPHAARLMRAGFAASATPVRRLWAREAALASPTQFDQDLLSRDGDGEEPYIDPAAVVDDRRIERMARILCRTPAEIRAAYESLAARVPLRLG